MVETYFAIKVYALYAMLAILAICCIVIAVIHFCEKRKK